ncbi:MAG TPA: hypothetical protein VFJ57_01845 [Solirubrobacterales bacterium]|nr:hypothetical protein [Solirubrobacterales bacterium]
MLVLLASACFPVVAHAETTYEAESPTVTGKPLTPSKEGGGTKAHASDNGGAQVPSESESTEGSESESSAGGASGNHPTNNGGGSSGQGSQGNGSSKDHKPAADTGKAGLSDTAKPLVSNQSDDSSGGGSSPLVPILIVVAVLAAISVGVVVLRQRRQGSPGSRVSPKAN